MDPHFLNVLYLGVQSILPQLIRFEQAVLILRPEWAHLYRPPPHQGGEKWFTGTWTRIGIPKALAYSSKTGSSLLETGAWHSSCVRPIRFIPLTVVVPSPFIDF